MTKPTLVPGVHYIPIWQQDSTPAKARGPKTFTGAQVKEVFPELNGTMLAILTVLINAGPDWVPASKMADLYPMAENGLIPNAITRLRRGLGKDAITYEAGKGHRLSPELLAEVRQRLGWTP